MELAIPELNSKSQLVMEIFLKINFVTTFENVKQNPEPFLDRLFLIDYGTGIKKLSTWADD